MLFLTNFLTTNYFVWQKSHPFVKVYPLFSATIIRTANCWIFTIYKRFMNNIFHSKQFIFLNLNSIEFSHEMFPFFLKIYCLLICNVQSYIYWNLYIWVSCKSDGPWFHIVSVHVSTWCVELAGLCSNNASVSIAYIQWIALVWFH